MNIIFTSATVNQAPPLQVFCHIVTFSHRLSTCRHTVPEHRAKYILPVVIITQTITVATATYPTVLLSNQKTNQTAPGLTGEVNFIGCL